MLDVAVDLSLVLEPPSLQYDGPADLSLSAAAERRDVSLLEGLGNLLAAADLLDVEADDSTHPVLAQIGEQARSSEGILDTDVLLAEPAWHIQNLGQEGVGAVVDGSDETVLLLDLFDEPLILFGEPPKNGDEVPEGEAPDIVVTARRVGSGWGFTGVFLDSEGVASDPFNVAQLSPGDTPDIIEWTSPFQPRENVAANPAVTITVVGNTVLITGKIAFQGPGASDYTNGRLLAALNSIWSGTFGIYTVVTNITVGTGGFVANVSSSPLGNQLTSSLGGSEISTLRLEGASDHQAAYQERKFAHEFGHVLGLMDLFGWADSERAPGYDQSIMGWTMGPPTEQNIRDLLSENGF